MLSLYQLLPWHSDYYTDAMTLLEDLSASPLLPRGFAFDRRMRGADLISGDGFLQDKSSLASPLQVTSAVLTDHWADDGTTYGGAMMGRLGLNPGRLHVRMPHFVMRCVQMVQQVVGTVGHVAAAVGSVTKRYAPALIFAAVLGTVFYYTTRCGWRASWQSGQAYSTTSVASRVSSEKATTSDLNADGGPCVAAMEADQQVHRPAALPTTAAVLHYGRATSLEALAVFNQFSLLDALSWSQAVLAALAADCRRRYWTLVPVPVSIPKAYSALEQMQRASTCAQGILWHEMAEGQGEVADIMQDLVLYAQPV